MTYLKAHEWLRCIRSERSKKLVEISLHKIMQHEMRLPREVRHFMNETLIVFSNLTSDEYMR
jgi:hypothetical protein